MKKAFYLLALTGLLLSISTISKAEDSPDTPRVKPKPRPIDGSF